MPFVQISLLRGKSREYVRAIADGVHQGLIDAYSIPPDDRFQIVHQCDPEDFLFDTGYLGIRRSVDVVFIHLVAGNWRDTVTKQKLYKAIADQLEVKPGLRREDVQIILSPNDRDDWSFGNGVASYVKADNKP
jgi:phenylpyruvate tautomerase PptA (4-oxalocrotonate tautomerase family)